MKSSVPIDSLHTIFGSDLQENVRLSNYTTAHVGGTVDAMVMVHSSEELEKAALALWDLQVPFRVLGAGSNVLVSDKGYRGVVVINRARTVKVNTHVDPPNVWAESGANLGGIARQVALRGLSGLEWAATVPGTVGGAVYGNAGAHGGDMNGSLALATILHPNRGKETWTAQQLGYEYRSSALKRSGEPVVILAAQMKLTASTPAEVQARMDAFNAQRRSTQPPGASMGSMFKNPQGDYAGRLIEAAGLKGARCGGAEISSAHANFFVNDEGATARDIYDLICLAQQKVMEQSGVRLDLEVELLGEWPKASKLKGRS